MRTFFFYDKDDAYNKGHASIEAESLPEAVQKVEQLYHCCGGLREECQQCPLKYIQIGGIN
jgi:hypothetical protein